MRYRQSLLPVYRLLGQESFSLHGHQGFQRQLLQMPVPGLSRFLSCYVGVIDIIDCVPAIVSTAGTKQSTDPFACSSENCARWTLKALGKTESTAGHYSHIFQSWLVTIGGDTFSRWMANWKLDSINEKLA